MGLATLLLLACKEPLYIDPRPRDPEPETPVGCPDDGGRVADLAAMDPPKTVVVFVADTVRRDFLGHVHPEWDTTPHLGALMGEAVTLDHVLAPRGLTSVSLTSFLTGAYPKTHGVRSNDGNPPDAATVRAQDAFHAAGYRTYGLSTNQCELIDGAVDERWCHSVEKDEDLDQELADAEILPEFFARLDARPADEPVYAYLHYVDPHDPFDPRSPWFESFHPEPYDGPLLAPMGWDVMLDVQDGEIVLDDADRRYFDALYASQIRDNDEHFGALLQGLADRGRLDDAVVLYVMDHGEELAWRTGYIGHGCSVYNLVLDVSAVLYAPGRLPGGVTLGGWSSLIDLVPTLLEMSGIERTGVGEGRSLVPELQACADPSHPVYFERGSETAGMVMGEEKIILDPAVTYDECKGFDANNPYVGVAESLYDLAVDPYELDNRAQADPGRFGELRDALCAWITDGTWAPNQDASNNLLLATCAP